MSHGSPDPEYPMHVTVCRNLRGQFFPAIMVWDKHSERFVISMSGSPTKTKEAADEKALSMAELRQLEIR